MPPRVSLKGNGRSPLNPSSIHFTCSIYAGTKKEDGYRCHSLPMHSTEPESIIKYAFNLIKVEGKALPD